MLWEGPGRSCMALGPEDVETRRGEREPAEMTGSFPGLETTGDLRLSHTPKATKALELVERLAAIPYTGAVTDILDEAGLVDQVLPAEIQCIVPGWRLAGRALTVLGQPSSNGNPDQVYTPFLRMLGDIKPGDVLVTQPNDSAAAHLGELSSETAKYYGARGAVIDGGARDTEYMYRLRLPVFARYTTPNDILHRWEMVDYNVPITIGGVSVAPGDYILGDRGSPGR